MSTADGVTAALSVGLVHGRPPEFAAGAHHHAFAGRTHIQQPPSAGLYLQGGYGKSCKVAAKTHHSSHPYHGHNIFSFSIFSPADQMGFPLLIRLTYTVTSILCLI